MEQILYVHKCSTDNLSLYLFYQFLLLEMTLLFGNRPNENQTVTMISGSFVKFSFRGRYTFFIFIAIKIAEQT